MGIHRWKEEFLKQNVLCTFLGYTTECQPLKINLWSVSQSLLYL